MEECIAWRFALGLVLFSGFINDPDNIQGMPITSAGDINLGETHIA